MLRCISVSVGLLMYMLPPANHPGRCSIPGTHDIVVIWLSCSWPWDLCVNHIINHFWAKYHRPANSEININCYTWYSCHSQAVKFLNQFCDNRRLAFHQAAVVVTNTNPYCPLFPNCIQCNKMWNAVVEKFQYGQHKPQMGRETRGPVTHSVSCGVWEIFRSKGEGEPMWSGPPLVL